MEKSLEMPEAPSRYQYRSSFKIENKFSCISTV